MPYPLVTIPIAAYKSQTHHLAAAIESALNQTWPNLEVIISDDSPDNSLQKLVVDFNDKRLRYIHNNPSLGVAQNYWHCFKIAQGQFIAILNHDDLFSPTFIERLVTPLINDADLALSFCDHWLIDDQGNILENETNQNSLTWGRSQLQEQSYYPFYDLFTSQKIPMAMGSIFRNGLLPEKCPDQAGPAYDLWLTYLLCRGGYGAFYVQDRLSSWRTHANNLTSQNGIDWSVGAATCWAAALADQRLTSVHQIVRQKVAVAYFYCALRSQSNGNRWACIKYGFKSLQAKPSIRGLYACFMPFLPKAQPTKQQNI